MIEQQEELDFLRTFWDRKAVVAYTLFVLNILIFILLEFSGGSMNTPTLLAFGAKSNPHIDNGEIWRFITPIFLHIGFLHLFFNSYALWVVGPQVEKLYGGARFLLLYVLTGIAGVAASYWYNPDYPSAGASGAIFGLFGVLLVFSFKYRKTVPAFFTKALGKGVLLTVGINLVIGYMIPQVDNSAHIGGLIAGGALAAVVPFQKPGESSGTVFKVVQASLVLLVAVSFFQVTTHYRGPVPSIRNLMSRFQRDNVGSTDDFRYAIKEGQKAFEHSEEILSSGDVRKLWEPRKELSDAIKLLQQAPSVGRNADELGTALLDLLHRQSEYVEQVERSANRASDFLGVSPQSSRYRRLKVELDKWLEREEAMDGNRNAN